MKKPINMVPSTITSQNRLLRTWKLPGHFLCWFTLALGSLFLFSPTASQAQCPPGVACNASFPSGPISIEIELTGPSASLNNATLSNYVTPAGGCGYAGGTSVFDFLVFTSDPVFGDMEPAGARSFNCDSVGTSFTRYIVLEDSPNNGMFEDCDASPVLVTITVSDPTVPTIATMGDGPDCGETLTLQSDSSYTFTGMDPTTVVSTAYDCAAELSWLTPDFSDNCGIDSLVICFRAESTPAPSSLPTTIAYGPNSTAVPAIPITVPSTTFYGNADACTATTRVIYKVYDPSGNVDSCHFLVTVEDNEDPTWTDPMAELVDSLSADATVGTFSAFDPVTTGNGRSTSVVLDCNSPSYTADSAYLAAFVPDATDNCDTSVSVTNTLANPVAPEDCMTPQLGIDNIYESFSNFFSAADNCDPANALDHDMMATDLDGDEERLRLLVYTSDPDAPWLDQDSSGVKAPVALTNTVSPNPSVSGSKAAGLDFTFTGDTVKFNITAGGSCEFEITTDTLSITGLDCRDITYGWSVTASEDQFGNPTGLAGTSSDAANDNDIAGSTSTNNISIWPTGTHAIQYTAEDECGNVSTFDFVLQICDTIPPVITNCPPSNAVNDTICAIANNDLCETTVNWIIPTPEDCAGISSFTATATDAAGNAITINTGNVPGGTCASVSGFAGVYGPGNWITNLNAGTGAVDLSGAPSSIQMFEDGFGGAGPGVNTEVTTTILEDGVVSFNYDYNNTLGAPDDFGYLLNGTYVQLAAFDIANGFQIVSVSAGDNFGFRLEGSGGFLVADVVISNFQFECQQGAWADFPVGVSKVQYIAEDNSGNRDTCDFYINVKDQQAPEFTNSIADQDLFIDEIDCNNPTVPNYISLGSAEAQDNCSVDSVSQSPMPGTPIPLTAIHHDSMFQVVLTAWSAGLSTSDTFKVTVIDNTDPIMDCPDDVTIFADGDCEGSLAAYPSVSITDDCEDVDLTLVDTTRSDGMMTSAAFGYGTTTVTYSYTDAGGNSANCAFTVTVADTTAPVIATISDATINTSSDGTGDCSATYSWTPVVTDNCDNAPTIISSPPSGSSFGLGANPVVVTAIDADGNSHQISFTVTVVDDEAPSVYNCPGSLTINSTCANTPVPSITHNVSDNCGPVTVVQIPAAGTPLSDVTLSMDVAPAGLSSGDQYEIIVRGTDPAGLQDSCTTTVTIFDLDAPVPTEFPIRDTFYSCATLVLGPYTAVLCDGSTINAVANRGTSLGGGQYEFEAPFDEDVVWTYAHPTNGTSFVDVQRITVEEDDTAPTLICPEGVSAFTAPGRCDTSDVQGIALSEASSVLMVGVGQYADSCSSGSDLVVEYALSGATTVARKEGSNAGTETFERGTTTVTYYVTDAENNTASCSLTVTVEDNQAPILSATPANVTVECDMVPDAPTITASDNCDGSVSVSYSEVRTDGGCPHDYTLTRTWSATDAAGNSVGHVQTVTVQDTEGPDFLTVNVDSDVESFTSSSLSLMFDNDFGDCGRDIVLRVNNSNVSDNCTDGGFRFRYAIDGGTPTPYSSVQADASRNFPVGTTAVTFFALDSCGNESQVDVNITVRDVDEPQVACLTINRNLPANGPLTVAATDFINPFGTLDNCTSIFDLVFRINGDSTFDCSNVGVNMIDIEVVDEAGNVGSCIATLNIQETFDPVAVCQDITVQLDADGRVSVSGSDLDGGSTDNCPGTLSFLINGVSSITYNCGDVGTFPVTMTVIDQAGNSDDCTAMITVEDNVAPNAICQDITVSLDESGIAIITAADIDNGSNDSCGIASMSLDINTFSCSDMGENTVVLTVTDNNGNSATCSATVTVQDVMVPTAICQNVDVELGEDGTLMIAASMFNGGSTDNCTPSDSLGLTVNGMDSLLLDCMDLGTQSITLTVTDTSGNSATCTADLTVHPNDTVKFTAATMSGSSGTQVDIPVTVDNFWEMRSFQFTVSVVDPSVATLDDIIFNLNGTTAVTGSGDSRAVSWNAAAPPDGEDLMDGDTAFFVRVTLIGAGGTSTGISLNGSIITPLASQGCAPTEVVTDINLCDGQVDVTVGTSSLISGTISREGDPVRNVVVALTGTDGMGDPIDESTTTDASGNYSFNVPNGSTVTITPSKDTDVRNGVESIDASIIRSHTASGTPVIMTPYRLIAGDVNLSSGAGASDPNAIDAGIIQNLVAGNFADFSIWGNTSWRFVDAAHIFADPENPWTDAIPDNIALGPLMGDAPNQNFEGIKNGDVGAVRANPQLAVGTTTSQDRSDKTLYLQLEDQQLSAGTSYRVDVRARDFQELLAYQMTLDFDPHALSFVNFEAGVLSNMVLGNKKASDGQLAVVWAEALPTNLSEEDVLFSLVFKATQSGSKLSELLSLTDAITQTQAFDIDYKSLDVELEFNTLTSTPGLEASFELYQNRPNPFRAQTVIGFKLPQAGDATLSIFDVTGRKIFESRGSYNKGYNEITINNTEVNAAGVLYYQLETTDHTALRKMTVLK